MTKNSSSISQFDQLASRARTLRGKLEFSSHCIFAAVVLSAASCSMLTKSDLPQCLQDEDCAQQGLASASCDAVRHVCVFPQIPPNSDSDQSASGGSPNDVGSGGTGSSGIPSGQAGSSGVVDTVEIIAAWSGAEQRNALGDSEGGSPYQEQCGNDEVLVGLKVAAERWAEQVVGICQRIGVRDEGTTYSLEFAERRELPGHPETAESQVSDLSCPTGQAVVGVRVSQQNHQALLSYVVLPRVWLTCGELYVDNTEIRWRQPVEIGPVSGSYADDTAWFASDELSDAQVAVGVHGRSGSWVDQIGLNSGNLRLRSNPS